MNRLILSSILLLSTCSITYCQETEKADSLPEVFVPKETAPEFPGGMGKFFKFISKELKYPKEAKKKKIAGQVIVEFIVSAQGHVIKESVTIQKSVHKLLDDETIRVVKMSPDWIPGKRIDTNLPINGRVVIPIVFDLNY